MNKALPSHIQEWVTTAAAGGLSAASIRKYHTMLPSVFRRAVHDRIITFNPCEENDLPEVITQRRRTLTPDEYRRVLTAVPDRYRLMVRTAVETGLCWGELIALHPRHLDFVHGTLTVQETIVEVSKRADPEGQGMIVKPYPNDNERRRSGLRPAFLDQRRGHIADRGLGSDDLLFATPEGTPISRDTFRSHA